MEIRRLGLWNVQLVNFLRCYEGRGISVHGKQGSTIPQESTDKKTHVRYHRQIMCTTLVMGIKQIWSRIRESAPKYLIHSGLYISLVVDPFRYDKAIQILEMWPMYGLCTRYFQHSGRLHDVNGKEEARRILCGFKFQYQKMYPVFLQSHYLQSMETIISFIVKDMMALEGSGLSCGVYWLDKVTPGGRPRVEMISLKGSQWSLPCKSWSQEGRNTMCLCSSNMTSVKTWE